MVQKPQGQSEWRIFYTEYPKNKLKYDAVEFLEVTRGPWKQQILVGCFKWVWSGMPGHVQSDEE